MQQWRPWMSRQVCGRCLRAAFSLGGMSSYLIGRIIPQRAELKGLKWVQAYGSPALLAAWVPFVGDPLCVAAGWLRINPWSSALFMAIGKFVRYLLIGAVVAA
jgi:membrane protein YqaA with SNARE-associated domain